MPGKTRLRDKKLLQAKLHEFYSQAQDQTASLAIEKYKPATPPKIRRK